MGYNTYNCEKCGEVMKPAPAKLRTDGEQTYCGYLPCPCDRKIMTEYGVVYPKTDGHDMLVQSGQYNIGDLI